MRTRLFAAIALLGLVVFAPASVAVAQEEEHPDISHAAEHCIHVLEDGGEPEDCHAAPSPILPEPSEFIWGSISFIVLFAALAKFAYPPIKKAMEDRTDNIRQSLDDAERVKAEAEGVLAEYQRQLADARSEANRIIEEARQTADQLRRDLVARAEQEATELRQRTNEDIQAAKDRALGELQGQVRDITIEIAEKIVEKELDRETNRALIDAYIAELGRR